SAKRKDGTLGKHRVFPSVTPILKSGVRLMPDDLTLFGIGGVIAFKDILNKLLGPSADYLGEGAKSLVEKSAKNLNRIFSVAYEKLKDKVDSEGAVNPRVLKGIWDEGRFIEDTISAEYFGGVLAGARTADGLDDTAVSALALLRSMSSNQLRVHFVVYSLIASFPFHRKNEIDGVRFWQGLRASIPVKELLLATNNTDADGPANLLLAIKGLSAQNLFGRQFAFDFSGLREHSGISPEFDKVILSPTKEGGSLFLRALGQRGLHPELITSINVDYSLSENVRSSVQLPPNISCYYQETDDARDTLRDEVEASVFDLEAQIDDLRDEIRSEKAKSAKRQKPAPG
ncbi:MAG: hypothetical protein ABUL64_02080, partial [Singulisphaera sp.]